MRVLPFLRYVCRSLCRMLELLGPHTSATTGSSDPHTEELVVRVVFATMALESTVCETIHYGSNFQESGRAGEQDNVHNILAPIRCSPSQGSERPQEG